MHNFYLKNLSLLSFPQPQPQPPFLHRLCSAFAYHGGQAGGQTLAGLTQSPILPLFQHSISSNTWSGFTNNLIIPYSRNSLTTKRTLVIAYVV